MCLSSAQMTRDMLLSQVHTERRNQRGQTQSIIIPGLLPRSSLSLSTPHVLSYSHCLAVEGAAVTGTAMANAILASDLFKLPW